MHVKIPSEIAPNVGVSIMEEDKPAAQPRVADDLDEEIDSATLARLIEEVRNEGLGVGRNYDRTYNRHNR